MKRISEEKLREEASQGKNNPMARSARVQPLQNGEVKPSRQAARRQPGTDVAREES